MTLISEIKARDAKAECVDTCHQTAWDRRFLLHFVVQQEEVIYELNQRVATLERRLRESDQRD